MIQHLAIVMDGNRRWALKNKLEVLLGHSKGGINALKIALDFCLDRNILYLSLYAFSLENLKRTEQEKNFLFNLIITQGKEWLSEALVKGVKIKFVGERSLFPQTVLEMCEELEKATEHLTQLHLNILFCYGGRQEIVAGVKVVIQKVKAGLLKEEDFSEKVFEDCLWMNGTPDPELIIRTGGVKRLSNFLLYQAAYSEFCFFDCLWPEITKERLEKALSEFLSIKRNFGI